MSERGEIRDFRLSRMICSSRHELEAGFVWPREGMDTRPLQRGFQPLSPTVTPPASEVAGKFLWTWRMFCFSTFVVAIRPIPIGNPPAQR
jgi:hypothetical protein